MRTVRPLFSLLLLLAVSARAETVSTRCQIQDVQVTKDYTAYRLIGCGEGFSSNILWHLDRLDSPSGALDNRFARMARRGTAVVYVMDSGVERDHEEFQRAEGPNVIAGLDPTTGSGQKVPLVCHDDPAVHPCVNGSPA